MRTFAIAVTFGLVIAGHAMAAPANDECTGDCLNGYAWARQNAIKLVNECAGQSAGFVKGCRAYLDGTGPSDNRGEGAPDDTDE